MRLTIFIGYLLALSTAVFGQHGLHGAYFDGKNFDKLIHTQRDAQLDFYWSEYQPPYEGMTHDNYSIRWTGFIIAPETGTYTFSAIVDDGLKLFVGGVLVIDSWQMNDNADYTGKVNMEAGKKYPIQEDYFNGLLEGELHLLWEKPSFEPSFWERLTSDIQGEKIPSTNFLLPKKKEKPPVPIAEQRQVKPDTPKPKKKQKQIQKATKVQDEPTLISEPILEAKTEEKITQQQKAIDTLQTFLPKNILFERSKPIILSESYEDLDILAARLVEKPTVRLVISGHTDNVGDAALNMDLSKQRARTVARYLVKKGVHPTRITAYGYGGTKPITTNKTEKGRSKNRRVEFELH